MLAREPVATNPGLSGASGGTEQQRTFQNQSQHFLGPDDGMPVVDLGGIWSNVQIWHNTIAGEGPAATTRCSRDVCDMRALTSPMSLAPRPSLVDMFPQIRKGLVIVTLHKQFDAAYPPSSTPPGCTVVAGYIGGSEAVNVWTPAEWQRFKGLYQVPIWVPNTDADPKAQASEACAATKKLGWAANEANRRLIVFDLETAEVPRWYASVAAEVAAQGFQAAAYGSLATVLANKAAVVWSADWDGDYALDRGQSIEATQYASDIAWDNTQVDYSAVSDWWTAHCGIGPRWS